MNQIPDEKQIEELLESIAPHTTSRLETKLADAPWSEGVVNRRRSLQAISLAVLLVASVFAASPQGHAFAQDVLQFFTRTQSDSYYEPVSNLTFEETTPFHQQCGIPIRPTCSVEEIRSMVDFEVKELGTLPGDLYYVGATGGPDWVDLHYEYPNRLAGGIGILVEATGRPAPGALHIVPPSAYVEKVNVGNLPAEYYQGVLFQDDQGNVTWQPNDPTVTLRWADGGSSYTLFYFFQNQEDPLTMEELIAVAESMTTEPVAK
ncbi:MAG TPA: hypothetical protein VFQ23_10520 [Anaerolineales bacterium]|nr:hypothetical protein [Anaerolineales bacterium]